MEHGEGGARRTSADSAGHGRDRPGRVPRAQTRTRVAARRPRPEAPPVFALATCRRRAPAARAHTTPGTTLAAALASVLAAAPAAHAQAPADSAGRDSARARRLEAVTVTAVRSGDAAVARTTLGKADLERAYTGQDVPMLLQQSPAVTTFAQSGSQWNYSYFALRGVAQSRINLTLDGVPLNEPEDQQLYFSNFADLAGSLQSAQVQRGVGTSSYGHASLGGSVNFESEAIATARGGGEAQLGGGSFGARRAAVEYKSGLRPGRTAFYARAANQYAGGYRRGSSHAGNSGFLSAGYFGDRDVVKLTLLTGEASNGQAYTPVPLDAIRADPRANPLEGVGDRFRQSMAALTYTRAVSPNVSVATTAYGFRAGGWYEYPTWEPGAPDPRWELASRWGGVVSAVRASRGGATLDAGVHGSAYSRDHRFGERADLGAYGYANRGYKREASAFAKLARAVGPVTVYGDLQLRTASFRYRPTEGAAVPGARASWHFVNPKAGLVWRAAPALSLFASYGATGREPTRADLLGGADDVAAEDADSLLPLTRVRPERLRNGELGADWRQGPLAVRANAFAMEFRDEIGLTGATTPLGYDVRRNFGRSYRRGVEIEAALDASPTLTLAATAAASRNRVREDRDPATGLLLRGVPLALSPALVTTQRATWRARALGTVNVEGRYQSRSYLAPTRDARLSAPAFFVLDGGVTFRAGRHDVLVQGRNLFDRLAFPSGDVRDGVARYFVLAPRSVEVTARLRF